jgi:phage gp16-like protein
MQRATKPAFNPSHSGPARPAQFDRASQHRRSMLAMINMARSALCMEEDDYRQIVFDKTGRLSLKEASAADLEAVLAVMTAKGWQAIPKSGKPRPAQHPVAMKARALWISLYHLGAVHNPAEAALEAFAKRQLKCERLVWANQSQGFQLIEALKAMAIRAGWPQSNPATGRKLTPLQLQELLCGAILHKLQAGGAVPEGWTINRAAERLCGFVPPAEPWTSETYTVVATQLGQQLRALCPDQVKHQNGESS